jgi:uncharacterized protein (DUF362 family)
MRGRAGLKAIVHSELPEASRQDEYGADRAITRRSFLYGAAAALTSAVACRRPHPWNDADFTALPATSDVLLLAASSYEADLSDAIGRGLRELGLAVAGRRVLLKPNMVEFERGTIINTHPLVVGAAARAFLSAGAREVIVGEGAGHRRDTEYLLTATGLYDCLRDLRLRFVDLNHDDVRRVRLRSHFMDLPDMALPAAVLDSDLVVSMPKLKTHHWAGMTCGMKNLFGVVPGAVYGWPKNLLHLRGIHNAIVDLTATVRPALVIVDAIVAMEGDGPIMGTAKPTGFLAMGRDPVAVDATCARAIGIDPAKLAYLDEASRFLGNSAEARIRHRGEPAERFRFKFQLIDPMKGLRTQSA